MAVAVPARIAYPYTAMVRIRGTTDLLLNRWRAERNNESGDYEACVYRTKTGELGIPGSYLRGAILEAAGFYGPLADVFRSGIACLPDVASLRKRTWDYLDRRRVRVKGRSITRTRPAMKAGWEAEFEVLVTDPVHIVPPLLQAVIEKAGMIAGVGDFRPVFGRFEVVKFEVVGE